MSRSTKQAIQIWHTCLHFARKFEAFAVQIYRVKRKFHPHHMHKKFSGAFAEKLGPNLVGTFSPFWTSPGGGGFLGRSCPTSNFTKHR